MKKGTKGRKTIGFLTPHHGHDGTSLHLVMGTIEAILGTILLIMGMMSLCYGLFLCVMAALTRNFCHLFEGSVILTESDVKRYQEDGFGIIKTH